MSAPASPVQPRAHVAVVNPEAVLRPEFQHLQRTGMQVTVLRSAAEVAGLVRQRRVDVLIVAAEPDGAAVAQGIAELRQANPKALVVAVASGRGEVNTAQLMADQVLTEPLDALQLRLALARSVLEARRAVQRARAAQIGRASCRERV